MTADVPAGATPLDPDERASLIPRHIATQGELNEWEQLNIARGEQWARTRRRDLLTEPFVRQLHRRMFGQTWHWAGSFRRSDKNIGVHWRAVPVDLKTLLDDARYQIGHASFGTDELAVRFHHRLVAIHPFPNGNGRHARLMADLLVEQLGAARFSWGSRSLVDATATRAAYISALREADRGNSELLVVFARS